ncbi:MAG: class I SAM-dependent methyltransferase, partial [Pseudomonadales bacterium]
IGCGWGLLGLFCAKHFDARVTGIDADANVAAYLELHADLNRLAMGFEKKSFQQLTTAYLSQFDLIIGADICFWDDLGDQLFNLIKRAQRGGVSQIVIADPCRGPFDTLATRTEQAFPYAERVAAGIRRPARATGELLIVKQPR